MHTIIASSTPNCRTWTPKCGVHVPAELIPEAMEFEQNWLKFGIVKSALYDARMASYEAEWGGAVNSLPIIDSSAMSTSCFPHVDNAVFRAVSTMEDMSHLSAASYDNVTYISPVDNQPLSSSLDDEDDDLVLTPPMISTAFSSHFAIANTGLSSAMGILCVSPNGGRPKAKAKSSKRLPVASGRTTRSSHDTPTPLAKKKSSAPSKRKAVDELRRPVQMDMRWTPIHYAVMGKRKHIVALLLKYAPTPYVTVNRRDAAGEGYPSIVRLLLDNGADIDDRDNEAALTDQVRAAETLLEYRCNTEIKTKSSSETALELAERVHSHLVSIALFEYHAKKLPGEVVEVVDEGHRALSMPVSPSKAARRQPPTDKADDITYLKLAYAEGWVPLETSSDGTMNMELLPETDWTEERPPANSFFLFRALVPLQLKSGPDAFAPKLLPVETKEPCDVVEVSRIVTFPRSSTSFVEVHPMGWLSIQLPSGRKLLERTTSFTPSSTPSHPLVEPSSTVAVIAGKSGVLERGHFFYCVHIAVGIREFPDIMSPRVGKGFHINTIVEGSQRFTPQSSPITLPESDVVYAAVKDKGWVALDRPSASKVTVERISVVDILAVETTAQNELFADRNTLSSSSLGVDSIPLVRHGYVATETAAIPVVLEEIKHPANAILLTFPWKQLWWHVSFPDKSVVVVELQHGLHGGFRAVFCNGNVMAQSRLLWDSGDTIEVAAAGHTFQVSIVLEGGVAFFSSAVQYYTYSLVVDGHPIRMSTYKDN
ncbi:hypothetical protein DYB30_009673 [Aphanomyces astaci]|uniref:Uncharacterized protein n=1 Tax=Aphanomyces astaci TaxID=112090 RepID=A0A397C297_APHAT|nr:hypothetical protein DYB30_009673 [Aphanomyces astaci]